LKLKVKEAKVIAKGFNLTIDKIAKSIHVYDKISTESKDISKSLVRTNE